MKKIWRIFWIITVLAAAATIVGGAFAARISEVLCAAVVFLSAAWLAIFYAHFHSIEYFVEKKRLIIRSGFLIRAERVISISDILWKTTVKLGSAVLFSVVHTAAGKAVIFAVPDLGIPAPTEQG